MNIPLHISQIHESRFNQKPLIVRSPGRINLIGEHTDYNNGFVLPAATDKAVYITLSASTDATCHWFAADFSDEFTTTLDVLQPSPKNWPNYLLGIVEQFQKMGHSIPAFNCVVSGDVPAGGGMSSSAALECATGWGLANLFNIQLDKLTLTRMAQRSENEFVGLQCGIMDMFASAFGRHNEVIRLDCRSLEYEYFPLDLADYQIVLFDTGVKHSLASSEYNTRRQECEAGVALLQTLESDIHSLRDVSEEMLLTHQRKFDPLIFVRCLYVVQENERLLAACEDLKRGDLETFGQRMYGSHNGLRDMYEVSCKELDYLVSFTTTEKSVLGARMMGGGFGGCTINIIKADAVDDLFERIQKAYKIAMGLDLKMYKVSIEDGTSILSI
ncbi:galactokinase [Cytophagaceae bacterium DM2B3-1]|uniref:Galactokinase n=1 Tax=Xanthocytophaga flava TaxID=3048013 RepID=A0AAE3QV61_9BACT|nr:galactokinase [Xanthocytophaga flavus]MDJ1483865.1 galactokinase [Xanthocytophaga flavus]MDJ1494022.1 galactokinase [Xanthocytophaga flavus]